MAFSTSGGFPVWGCPKSICVMDRSGFRVLLDRLRLVIRPDWLWLPPGIESARCYVVAKWGAIAAPEPSTSTWARVLIPIELRSGVETSNTTGTYRIRDGCPQCRQWRFRLR